MIDILGKIKNVELSSLKAEFLDILEKSKIEKIDFVREMAEKVKRDFESLELGKVGLDDIKTNLAKYTKICEIEVNHAKIESQAILQKLTMRLLSLGLTFLIELAKIKT